MNGLIAWFVRNPIAANLLMLMVFVGGLTTMSQLDKEFFPQRKLNQIQVTVSYPGASPTEVEKQILLRIEEAVGDIDGIDQIHSLAREGLAEVTLDVASHAQVQRLLDEVKSRVDGIDTFPADAERPLISERRWRDRMISLVLAGDVDEATLKQLGEQIREELTANPHVSVVELRSPRKDELAIEVSEMTLRRHGLRFDDVVQTIRNASINLPGGKLHAADGDIQIQARGQAYAAADFENIVLIGASDGSQLRLGEIATIIDGFEEVDVIGRYNGRDSLAIDIYSTSHPNVLNTSRAVRDYVSAAQAKLPAGVELQVWRDMSLPFKERFSTLINNGLSGLALVFVLLLLFLRPQLALWVCAGIAVAFLGAIWLLPTLGTSLNMVSLFAFILILGIVVDDAIIVGEAVHSQHEAGLSGAEGAIHGTRSVMKPVCFAVISTMLFFVPFYFLPEEAPEPPSLADVVMLALSFSLLESLLILPSHLAHMAPEKPARFAALARLNHWRQRLAGAMTHISQQRYRPFLQRCLASKGLTLLSFVLAFFIAVAILAGGWLQLSFFPRVPADYLVANVTMRDGTPFTETERSMRRLVDAAESLKAELSQHDELPFAGGIESAAYGDSIRVTLELLNIEQYSRPVRELRDRWQAQLGPLSSASDIHFNYTAVPLGKPIELQVSGNDRQQLAQVSAELGAALAAQPGVFNLRNSLNEAVTEIEIRLKPHAQTLGISLAEVARQVRRGFYGEEAQRIPRLREDVRVMVRYPRSERESVHSIRNMRIRTADGSELPFEAVAELVFVPGHKQIERIGRERIALISAELQQGFSAAAVVGQVLAEQTPGWQQRYPDVAVSKRGEQQRQSEFLGRVGQLMILSLIAIYGLMAVVFRSYWQPLLIMAAIPFGFMGGIFGHVLLGQELAMFSILGMIACAGVVVNDNLVLVDRINQLREQGLALREAVVNGARDRFRAIVLTSMTTFIGLTPIMAETSIQSQFLKPMVVALAFGVLCATAVTLLFVPGLYLAGEALGTRLRDWRGRLAKRLVAVFQGAEA